MPQMPEPVDLRRSRQWNKLKVLTGAVMGELELMTLPHRAAVMMYSLSTAQQKEVNKYFDWKDHFNSKHGSALSSYERYLYALRYDVDTSTLAFHGQAVSFKKSRVAKSVLEIIFTVHGASTNELAYIDFLDEYRSELNALDINSAEQLRQAKRNINAKFVGIDVFPVKGTMELARDDV